MRIFELRKRKIFRIATNQDGLKIDRILIDVCFQKDIPEWLPILSCKARLYYPGINRQCNKCYEPGHQGWQCKNPKLTWKDYCKRLYMIGTFRREIFGHWLEPEDLEPEKDEPKKSNIDLRQLLNEPGALRELTSFFKAIKDVEKEDKKKAQLRSKSKSKQKKKD